ncbi:MAG: ArnT family glycosyltransferase [bacterium]
MLQLFSTSSSNNNTTLIAAKQTGPDNDLKGLNSHYVILTAILLLGAVLRLYRLGELNFWCDEDITALAVKGILQHGYPELPSGMIYFRSIFTTYLTAQSTAFFGFSEFALRLPSVLFSLSTGYVLFLLGKRIFSAKVGLTAAAILTFSFWDVEFARHARMYEAFAFFFTFALYAIYRGVVENEKRWLKLSAVISISTILVHILGVVLAFIYIVLAISAQGHRRRAVHLFCIAAGLVSVAMAYYFLIQYGFSIPAETTLFSFKQLFLSFTKRRMQAPAYGFHYHFFVIAIYLVLYLAAVKKQRQILLPGSRWGWLIPDILRTTSRRFGILSGRTLTCHCDEFSTKQSSARALGTASFLAVTGGAVLGSLLLFMQQALTAIIFLSFLLLFYRDRKNTALQSLARISITIIGVVVMLQALIILHKIPVESTPEVNLFDRLWLAIKMVIGYPRLYYFGFLTVFPAMTIVATIGLFILCRQSKYSPKKQKNIFIVSAFVLPLLTNGFVISHFIEYRVNFYLNPLYILMFAFAIFAYGEAFNKYLKKKITGNGRRFFALAIYACLVALACEQAYPNHLLESITREYGEKIDKTTAPGSHLRLMPDHASTGEFVNKNKLPDDIVIVTDWLAQYVYAGKIDYWLRTNAYRHQAFLSGNEYYDTYTGTQIISSLEKLQAALAKCHEKRIWLVVTLPYQNIDLHLSREIIEFLDTKKQKIIYQGRDGASSVYLFSEACPAPYNSL